jgi:glucose-6-phosphate 1-epimerase
MSQSFSFNEWRPFADIMGRVSLSMNGDLSLISWARNVNGKSFSFAYAYHTYLSVSDIRYDIF